MIWGIDLVRGGLTCLRQVRNARVGHYRRVVGWGIPGGARLDLGAC